MGEVRNCNCEVGSFIFLDGVLKSGKNSKNTEEIISDFMVKSRGEDRYILSFNREGIVFFKAIKRSELKKNFSSIMYFNGNSRGCEFGFRFLKKNEGFLMSLDDAYDASGNKYEMLEEDFVKIALECKKMDEKVNLGNVAEFIISGNKKDIIDRFRTKKHDVYIFVKINGELCKVKKASECKASFAGQKSRPLYDSYGLSSGYKKSNGSIKYDENLNIRMK